MDGNNNNNNSNNYDITQTSQSNIQEQQQMQEQNQADVDDDQLNDSPRTSTAASYCNTPPILSKSPNPFIVYLQEFRKDLSRCGNKKFRAKDVTRMAARKWRRMPSEEKLIYVRSAQRNRSDKQQRSNKDSLHGVRHDRSNMKAKDKANLRRSQN